MESSLIVALRDLSLAGTQAVRQERELVLPPYRQGGFEYTSADPTVALVLDIASMMRGWSFRLRFDTSLTGPCSRCLEPATVHIQVDSREVHDIEAGDEDLLCDFVSADEHLDVEAWALDARGLEFPTRVLCSDDCKGLCPVCGADMNLTGCDCETTQIDSRWDKLRELQLEAEQQNE